MCAHAVQYNARDKIREREYIVDQNIMIIIHEAHKSLYWLSRARVDTYSRILLYAGAEESILICMIGDGFAASDN